MPKLVVPAVPTIAIGVRALAKACSIAFFASEYPMRPESPLLALVTETFSILATEAIEE